MILIYDLNSRDERRRNELESIRCVKIEIYFCHTTAILVKVIRL